VQEELGLTMYTPAGCGGRRRVRLVGLSRGWVTEQGPVAAIIFVINDKVEACEHGKEKSLELQESMTQVGGPFGGTELGPLGLGREGEGLVIGGHFRLLPSSRVRCSGVVRERGSPVEVPFHHRQRLGRSSAWTRQQLRFIQAQKPLYRLSFYLSRAYLDPTVPTTQYNGPCHVTSPKATPVCDYPGGPLDEE